MPSQFAVKAPSRPKVLVIDDERDCSALVKLILQRVARCDVREENCARTAIATAHTYHPDLILLDIDMPEMDGGDVARKLSLEPALRDIPVVYCSGLVSPAETGARCGSRFISKPIDPALLVRTVREALIAGRAEHTQVS